MKYTIALDPFKYFLSNVNSQLSSQFCVPFVRSIMAFKRFNCENEGFVMGAVHRRIKTLSLFCTGLVHNVLVHSVCAFWYKTKSRIMEIVTETHRALLRNSIFWEYILGSYTQYKADDVED